MNYFYKRSLPLMLLTAVLVLAGCGKKKKGGDPGPGPAVNPDPYNTMWNNVNGSDYFSGYFQQYQAAYGSIVIVGNVYAFGKQIPAGTYNWSQFYAYFVATGAQQCVQQYGNSCGNSNGQWGQFNYGYMYNQYSNSWSTSTASYVTGGYKTGGASMNASLYEIMNVFYYAISSTYSSGYYGQYNSGYYYPQYYQTYPAYPSNGWNVSFNYSKGYY